LPGGKPAPSGAMLISQAAISSGVATRPRLGLSANAELQTNASAEAATARRLCIDMLHLAGLANAPARDAIEMIKHFVAAIGDEGGARWLDIAGIVRRAALQDAGPPFQCHAMRKRVSAIASSGSC